MRERTPADDRALAACTPQPPASSIVRSRQASALQGRGLAEDGGEQGVAQFLERARQALVRGERDLAARRGEAPQQAPALHFQQGGDALDLAAAHEAQPDQALLIGCIQVARGVRVQQREHGGVDLFQVARPHGPVAARAVPLARREGFAWRLQAGLGG